MTLRKAADLIGPDIVLAVPKPRQVFVRRAQPGEMVDGIYIDPAGPLVFVVTDPSSLNSNLWTAEEIDAAYDILPSGPVESDVPLEAAPVVRG